MRRPATRKIGAYTRAEIERRCRRGKKRAQIKPATLQKQPRRAEREQEPAKRTIVATRTFDVDGKRYGVIYADPPWRFEPDSHETGVDFGSGLVGWRYDGSPAHARRLVRQCP